MTKLRFTDYAHDSNEDCETVENLVDRGWDEETAERYAELHKPLYEVEATFEYDTETEDLIVVSAVVDGVLLRPVEDDD